MPTGHRKLEKLSELLGKLRKSYRKAISGSSTDLQSRQIQFDATNGLPSVPLRTTKEDDIVDFSFLRRHSSHQIKQKHSSAKSSCCARCARRSAQNVFLRHESLSRRKHKKETLNVLLLHEKTRICNVRRTSKHFPTTKVDFLTLKYCSRYDAHDNCLPKRSWRLPTASERLAYGSRPYM